MLVFGGSLGARSLNLAAVEALRAAPDAATCCTSPGRATSPSCAARLERVGGPRYRLLEYLDTLADPLAASDLVVARAGGSVFEIAAAGRPAVLVPIRTRPPTTRRRTRAGWRRRAPRSCCATPSSTPTRLRAEVDELLGDPRAAGADGRRRARARAARRRRADRRRGAARRAGERPRPQRCRRPSADLRGAAGAAALRRHRRRRHERPRADRAARSAPRCRAATAPRRRTSTSCARPGSSRAIGHDAAHVAAGHGARRLDRDPRRPARGRGGARAGVPVLHRGGAARRRPRALRRVIAVAGTHGKTTTAAMAAHVLRELRARPRLRDRRRAARRRRHGRTRRGASGEWLVVEADESDRSFLRLGPRSRSSRTSSSTTTRPTVARSSSSGVRRVPGAVPAERHRVVVGAAPACALAPAAHVRHVRPRDADADAAARATCEHVRTGHARSSSCATGARSRRVELPVPGRAQRAERARGARRRASRRAATSSEAARVARELPARRAAASSRAARRDGVRVFDDYAHHPTEVAATLEAARALEPRAADRRVPAAPVLAHAAPAPRARAARWRARTSSSCSTSTRRASGPRASSPA